MVSGMSTRRMFVVSLASVLFAAILAFAGISLLLKSDPYLWKTVPPLRGFNVYSLSEAKSPLVGMTRTQVEMLLGPPDRDSAEDCYWSYRCWRFPTYTGALCVYFSG